MEMRGRRRSPSGLPELLALIEQNFAAARQELETLVSRRAA
jgi:hypothetical protein